MTDFQFILFGLCGGAVFANIGVMLLVVWRLYRQPPRIRRVVSTTCKREDFGDVLAAWTAGPWEYRRCEEQAPGVVQIWFQEK